MPADFSPPILLLLHEGGWDEMLMVGVGLLVAYAVIMWTGRRSREDDDEDDEYEDEADDNDGGEQPTPSGYDSSPRPKA